MDAITESMCSGLGEGMENTAKPVQARSQKTKEKLLESALEMYAKKGYHRTTVDEIAAQAGVSIGIAYRYFRNKKDLLLSAVGYAADHIKIFEVSDSADTPDDKTDLRMYIERVFEGIEYIHIRFRDIHEEFEGLRHTDEEVRKLYHKMSLGMMTGVIGKLSHILHSDEDIREKAYLAVSIMEQYCHLKMNSELIGIDTGTLREKTIGTVLYVLK